MGSVILSYTSDLRIHVGIQIGLHALHIKGHVKLCSLV